MTARKAIRIGCYLVWSRKGFLFVLAAVTLAWWASTIPCVPQTPPVGLPGGRSLRGPEGRFSEFAPGGPRTRREEFLGGRAVRGVVTP
jgi:hypothetical protein